MILKEEFVRHITGLQDKICLALEEVDGRLQRGLIVFD